MEHIGLKIKELCKEKNITVQELSSKLGKTRQNVYKDFGRNNFTNKTLQKYADVIGVDIVSILGDNLSRNATPNENPTIQELKDENARLRGQIEAKDQIIAELVGKHFVGKFIRPLVWKKNTEAEA